MAIINQGNALLLLLRYLKNGIIIDQKIKIKIKKSNQNLATKFYY